MKYTPVEIHDQYNALEKTLAELTRRQADVEAFFAKAAPKRLICIGCGSSYMLSKSMASLCNQRIGATLPAMAFAAGDVWLNADAYAPLFEGAVVLALSRSGATSEVINAVAALRERCAFSLMSIACAADTPLEKAGNFTIVLPWAYDESVCQTRCVANLYAAGALTVSFIGGGSLADACAKATALGNAFIARHEEALKTLAARDWRKVVVLADGVIDGVAEEGALAFNEICQLPSNYYHILDVRHGPMVLVDKQTLVIIMRGTEACPHEDKLIADAVAKGAAVVVCCTKETAVPGIAYQANVDLCVKNPLRATLYLSVCQLLAYHKSTLNGSDPDAPSGLSAWIKL